MVALNESSKVLDIHGGFNEIFRGVDEWRDRGSRCCDLCTLLFVVLILMGSTSSTAAAISMIKVGVLEVTVVRGHLHRLRLHAEVELSLVIAGHDQAIANVFHALDYSFEIGEGGQEHGDLCSVVVE